MVGNLVLAYGSQPGFPSLGRMQLPLRFAGAYSVISTWHPMSATLRVRASYPNCTHTDALPSSRAATQHPKNAAHVSSHQRRCPSQCAPGAAHHAELAVPFHHAARHEAVARLKDVERQLLAGEHHVHHKQGQHLRGRASRQRSRDAAPGDGGGQDHGASQAAGGPPSRGGSAGRPNSAAHHLDHRPNRYVSREAASHSTAHRRVERDSPSGAAPTKKQSGDNAAGPVTYGRSILDRA